MLVKVFGAAVQGIDALVVTIEVNCSQGIRFFMVGLPDAAVKESHERIVSAVEHNGYRFPRKQVIVNMSPADIRKEGAAYDLPLAVGILASESIRRRVIAAREIQAARFADYPGIYCNAQMTTRLLNQFAVPDEAGLKRLKDAMNRFHLSARAYDRILKVARTIADLEGSEGVQVQHINEAVNYRNLDRENWGDR